MRGPCRLLVYCLGAAALVPPAALGADQGSAEAPYLSLRSAEIQSVAGNRRGPATNRQLAFRLQVAGQPPCATGRDTVSYLFLLDQDRQPKTGTILHGFPDLGVDRRLTIRCDPRAGRFVSAHGPVVVARAAAPEVGWDLELRVPVRVLGTLEFDWVAIAREGRRYDRLPVAGDSATWVAREIAPW